MLFLYLSALYFNFIFILILNWCHFFRKISGGATYILIWYESFFLHVKRAPVTVMVYSNNLWNILHFVCFCSFYYLQLYFLFFISSYSRFWCSRFGLNEKRSGCCSAHTKYNQYFIHMRWYSHIIKSNTREKKMIIIVYFYIIDWNFRFISFFVSHVLFFWLSCFI